MSDTVKDLPCGCRIGIIKDCLCSYHEGYNDGWEAGFADGLGAGPKTLKNSIPTKICGCHSPICVEHCKKL